MSTVQHREHPSGDRSKDRWRVVWRDPETRVQQVKTFSVEADAVRWRGLLDGAGQAFALRALDEAKPSPTGRTVADQVAHHIEHLTSVTKGTTSDYRGYLERSIVPHLGPIPLTHLGRDDVTAWVNALAKQGLSAKSIKHRHSLLSAALKAGVYAELIPTNVAAGVKMPRDSHDKVEMTTLTPDEVVAFLHATDERWRPALALLVGTGMRFGEATALQVGDVDLAGRTARIRRAWKHTDGHGHEMGPPKSRMSRRTITLGGVADIIAPLVFGRPAGAFVLTNSRGSPVRRSNFYGEAWLPALRRFAGDTLETVQGPRGAPRKVWTQGPGKRPRVHDMRHTYATIKIAEGKSMHWVQVQLGHESIDTTIRTYTHVQTADLATMGDVIDWGTFALNP